ncbi:hypothetical protein NLA06_09130 [Desulfomicrobium sp. ZS1]|uniref:hypothetical protein n=1 Tax=Desulfomicrobium sp. ZS1 TaxID=2952228 RepID=UPI0020B2432D|nr:hypothetical protein [Desulfomicrobium sp. ZS1]UTF48753.1 hypothetical protein NLA06_09130 [Desulfomicrobium sp. ZS1]
MKSWTPPTFEMVEKVLASVKKETDRQYFFSRLRNPLWVEPLRERGYFNSPPGMKRLPDGYVQYPHWPEMTYLVYIADDAPDQVIQIVQSLPKSDNPRVYENILDIALKINSADSAKLLRKIIEYLELNHQLHTRRFSALLQHWTNLGLFYEAFEIAKKLIRFREDPRKRDKEQIRKKTPNAPGSILDPAPRFHQGEYLEILEKGVRPLAESKPLQVAGMLIDAVAGMIQMGTHLDDFEKGKDEDFSEIWCRRLDKPNRDHEDVKEILVQAMVYACEQVYDHAPESIAALDKVLRNQRWKIFKRLRQHLYALHPNDQTLPWIRELILAYNHYSNGKYSYELQLMIRRASERFGHSLLSEDISSDIFATILEGPSKEEFQKWMGENYSEEAFQQRQRHFHRVQLRPFAALLRGKIRQYFEELDSIEGAKVITDDSYAPYGEMVVGSVSYRSPKSIEELESFANEGLLTYLNDWAEENREHQEKNNWLVETNFSALAGVFQTFFKEKISRDEARLTYWLTNRDKIERPIYVAAILKAMLELIKEKDFDNLDRWLEFCTWVLSHPDSMRMDGQPEPQDESRDHPDWGSSRRAVVDFIDACVNKDTEAPISARDGLVKLLRQACSQFDWRLDQDRPVLLNRDDPITEAINNTRSRALESLINFGFWVRRQLPEDPVIEVTSILASRIAEDTECPLRRPERALLGLHFGRLCFLSNDWSIEQKHAIFPQEQWDVWRDAFGNFILYNSPFKATYEVLRSDFEFALENLDRLASAEDDGKEVVDRIGQHLFTYYLWEVFPLTGADSLLERYYSKTNGDRQRWAQLFDHVGRSLNNSGKRLDKELTDRAVAYFDWRLEAAEPQELQEFTFWLEAECLDPEWRLRSFSKVLSVVKEKDEGHYMEVETLSKMLQDHLALVAECFAKITDVMDRDKHLFVSEDEAKPILKAGLKAQDPKTRENAERARENLLRLGRFDFLNLE